MIWPKMIPILMELSMLRIRPIWQQLHQETSTFKLPELNLAGSISLRGINKRVSEDDRKKRSADDPCK